MDHVVQHKAWQTPIKDQGPRGTCVAFASMAGLEWYFKKGFSTTKDLSENHTYNMFMSKVGSTCMSDPGIKTVNAADYLKTERVCEEAHSPYVTSTASSCAVVPPPCNSNKRHGITSAFKFFSPEFGGTGDEIATNTSFLESLVNLGLPVVMGVYVAGSDWSDGSAATGVIDLQKNANGTPAAAYGGHAMLLVGYNSTDNYFIFKNSWGADSGHDGYFHLSYEYLQTYAKYGYVIISTTNPG
jgi:C1A family cysteine protease